MDLITWTVDLNRADLVVGNYEEWSFLVDLNLFHFGEGDEPFTVTLERDGKKIMHEDFYSYESAIEAIRDFANGSSEVFHKD